MKKILSLFFAIFLLTSFAGCTDNSSEETGIQRGTIEGDTYTSKTTGLKFTKPSDWRYLSDKEIAQALGINEEVMSEKEFSSSLEEFPTLIDMMVIDDTTGRNLTIGYENLQVTMGGVVTEEEYMDAMSEYLQTMGNLTVNSTGTVKLSNQEYLKTTFSVEFDGGVMKTDYYIRIIDEYMNVITVTYTADITDTDIDSMFK